VEMYRTMADGYNNIYKKPVQVSLEIMMGCGMGVCYGCTIRTRHGLKQVCKDGPVFDMGEIVWEKPLGL
jgi:dihydroorotate dehydrogenase electron transfer subunit